MPYLTCRFLGMPPLFLSFLCFVLFPRRFFPLPFFLFFLFPFGGGVPTTFGAPGSVGAPGDVGAPGGVGAPGDVGAPRRRRRAPAASAFSGGVRVAVGGVVPGGVSAKWRCTTCSGSTNTQEKFVLCVATSGPTVRFVLISVKD